MKTFLALVASLVVFAFGTELAHAKKPAKVVSKVKVTSDFTKGELNWLGRPAPGFTLLWATRVINGEIAICGAVLYGDAQLRSESRAVMRRTYIVYNEQVILRNMLFFRSAKSVSDLNAGNAHCASTGIKAPKGRYNVRLRWDRGSAKG